MSSLHLSWTDELFPSRRLHANCWDKIANSVHELCDLGLLIHLSSNQGPPMRSGADRADKALNEIIREKHGHDVCPMQMLHKCHWLEPTTTAIGV